MPKPETRLQILQAALHVFSMQGFAGTTAQIAHAAQLGEGTLFRYFPTKAALADALFADVEHRLEQYTPGSVWPAQQAWLNVGANALLFERWQLSVYQALAEPAAFDYWVLYRADPRGVGARQRASQRVGWQAEVARALLVLVEGQVYHPGKHALALAMFVGQWEAAVQYVRALAPQALTPTPAQVEAVEEAFINWRHGVQLI